MKKILFVDDEPDLELLVKQKFRKQIKAGLFELLFAHSGPEALELLAEHPHIVIVISDLNMPGMSGFTLLKKVKEMNPQIQTLVVSAYTDIKTLRTAMNIGVYDFIPKPIDFQDLEKVLLYCLENEGGVV